MDDHVCRAYDQYHVVGVTTIEGQATLIYPAELKSTLLKYGGFAFNYCPMCGEQIKKAGE
jgi:hypothetical protein